MDSTLVVGWSRWNPYAFCPTVVNSRSRRLYMVVFERPFSERPLTLRTNPRSIPCIIQEIEVLYEEFDG